MKKMADKTRAVNLQILVKPWVKHGIVDLFMAFREIDLIPYHLFFLHQGIEKLCKAYFIASQARRYLHLDLETATCQLDSPLRVWAHNLRDWLGIVGIGIPEVRGWLSDPFLDILEGAYTEGRYPVPPQKSRFRKHGFPAVATHRNQEKAFAVSLSILKALYQEYEIVVGADDFPTPVQ